MNLNKVRKMAESLDLTVYQLNAFAEVVRDIVEKMPSNEKDENYSLSCNIFCHNVQNKLDVLTTQLLIGTKKSIGTVSELVKEVYEHE